MNEPPVINNRFTCKDCGIQRSLHEVQRDYCINCMEIDEAIKEEKIGDSKWD